MRVLLAARDRIAESMAGPGIRYWELAHGLAARGHEVTLTAPVMERTSGDVRCLRDGDVRLDRLLAGQDAVVTQWVTPTLLAARARTGVRLVVDAYDPVQLEALEADRHQPRALRTSRAATLRGVQSTALLAADAVLCASERQRDLWLGALMALGRLTPEVHDRDDTLRGLVDVVPFGCPATPPTRSGAGPRERLGLAPDDVVVLWGGGIWDWFDPQVLLRALHGLRDTHPQLKLVFMGLQRPGSGVGRTAAAAERLSDELGLTGRSVHFSYGWVPYDERQAWLLDADAGVSAHLEHSETRFAFRTRVLDYLWAGLPCLLTEGDAMADLVGAAGAGSVQAYGDVEGWQRALAALADDPQSRKEQAAAAHALQVGFTWPEVTRALERVLDRLEPRTPRHLTAPQVRELTRYVAHGSKALVHEHGAGEVVRRLRAGRVF